MKGKRKRRIGLIVLCSLGLGCYLFRHDLLVFGFDIFLKRQVSKNFSRPLAYESMIWEEGKLVATGLNISDEQFHLTIDKLEVALSFDWSKFHMGCEVHLIHPELTLVRRSDSALLPFTLSPLIPGKFCAIQLAIDNGVLQLNTLDVEERLYFSFASGNEEGELGTFFLSYDPHLYALPTTEVSFSLQGEEVVAGLKVGQMESRRFLQLMSFFYPLLRDGWENVQGQVEVMASATFSPNFSLSRLAGLIDAREVYLSNPILGVQVQAKGLHGEFTFPPQEAVRSALPFWKQVRACGTVEEGEWILGEGGVSEINAHLLLDPTLDPVLDLSGVWIHEGKEVPLKIQGKGSVLEDQSFWLELGVKLIPADEQESNAFVSICSTEKEAYVVQVEFNHLDVALLEMLGSPIPLTRGDLEGKLTGWVYDKKLARVQIDDCSATQIVWTLPQIGAECRAEQVKGEALYVKNDKGVWQALSLKGEMQEAFLREGERGNGQNNWRSPSFTALLTGEGSLIAAVLSCGTENLEVNFDFQKNEGWLRTDMLTEGVYGPCIAQLYPQLRTEGEFEIFGTFNPQKVFLSVQGRNLLIDHPIAAFHAKEMPHPALLTYSLAHGKWQGAWTVEKGTLIEKGREIYCDNIAASCEMDGSHFVFKDLSASYEEVQFSGYGEFDISQESFSLTSLQLEGSLGSIGKIFSFKTPLQGGFSTGAGGLLIEGQKGKIDWCVKAHLQDFKIPLQNGLALEEGQCELIFDSKVNLLTLQAIESTLIYKGKPYKLSGKLKKKEWWEFEAAIVDNRKEIARAVGIAQERPPAEIHFAFEKNKTHFLGVKLSVNRFVLKDWTELLSFEMTPLIPVEGLLEQLAFLNEAEVLPFQVPSFLPSQNLKGDIQARIAYEEQLSFEATSPSLSVGGKNYAHSALKGYKSGDIWVLESLETEDFSAHGRFLQESTRVTCTDFFLKAPTFSFAAEGVYNSENNECSGNVHDLSLHFPKAITAEGEGAFVYDSLTGQASAELHLSIENAIYAAESQKNIHALYSVSSGFVLQDIDFLIKSKEENLSAAAFQAATLIFHEEKWCCKKGKIRLYPEAACFGINFTDVESLPDSYLFEGEYQPAASLLKIGIKTWLKESPVYAQVQIDHAEEFFLGMLKISDDPKAPGIKGLYKEGGGWTSIQGEIKGLAVHLTKTAPQVLWGTVAVDPSLLVKYLPEEKQAALEKWKVGGNYQLEGHWDLDALQFKGAVKAHDFEVLGFHLQNVQAALSLSSEECAVENLTLEDPAGKLLIKQMLITKGLEWECHAPLILVQDFHPSKLQMKTSSSQPVKPLIIKKLSLYNLEGILGNLNTFSARGRLNFTNAFKKEFTLLDVPVDALKNLGLDLGLFTPVFGEAEFQLNNGKFLLTDLVNTYSEGKRSEFYLLGSEPSFLDLEGNIRLDLKMKQNVLLNVTEPYTLTVRGTLGNPKYSLVR